MIVDAHLGKALSALGRGERQTALDMFDHLVTPSGGKIAESVPDLAQRDRPQRGSGRQCPAEKLDHERIVRPVPAAPGQDPMRYRRYEIFHDVLAPTINRAIAAREEQRRVRGGSGASCLAGGPPDRGRWRSRACSPSCGTARTTEKLAAESRQLAAEADVNVARDPELSAAAGPAGAASAGHQPGGGRAADRRSRTSRRCGRSRTGPRSTGRCSIPSTRTRSPAPTGLGHRLDLGRQDRQPPGAPVGGRFLGHRRRRTLWPSIRPAPRSPSATGTAKWPCSTPAAERSCNSINVGLDVNDVRFVGSTGELAIATPKGVAVCLPPYA